MGNNWLGWLVVGFIALLVISNVRLPFWRNPHLNSMLPYGYTGYYGADNCFLGNIFGCGYNYGTHYYPQYQLVINTSPSGLGNVVAGGGTFTEGTSAQFSVTQSIVQNSPSTRYIFTGWTGDYFGTGLSGTVVMNSPKTVTANYQLQYYLTVAVVPSIVQVSGSSGWYNSSTLVNLEVKSTVVNVTTGSRLVFTGWTVDGAVQNQPVLQLTMNTPHTATAQFKQQYYLKVVTDRGKTSGEGWYDAGATAQVSVTTPESSTFGVKDIFTGWNGDVESGNQYMIVQMDSPKTVTAMWRTDATLLFLTIGAGLLALFGLGMVLKRRYPQYLTTLRQTFADRQ